MTSHGFIFKMAQRAQISLILVIEDKRLRDTLLSDYIAVKHALYYLSTKCLLEARRWLK